MQKKTIILITAIILAAVVAVTGGVVYWKQKNTKENTVTAATVVPWDINIEEEDEVPESNETISIPGYSRMVMKANTKEQTVSMGNPADNNCYFVIVLQLEDGTELFKSDYLKPGEGYETIVLNQELEAGEYQAVIRYYCYTLEEKSALNGGSSAFPLIVQ